MSIIKEIFGKDNGITEDDLNNIIGKYQETSRVECKIATDLHNKNPNIKEKVYHNVIKTVLGFLNKPENNSAGLLMIGINAPHGIIKQIEPIKNNDFRQDKLKNQLLADIVSIPSLNRSYTPEVFEVPVNGGYVTLVEVQKTDPNAVFYSKNENTAYIRHSDTTDYWPLGDMFKTALTKNYPIVYPVLTLETITPINNIIIKYSINSLLRNSGTSPGKDVVVLLKFLNPLGNSRFSLTKIEGYISTPADPPYIQQLEKDILQINSKPIYQNLNLRLGNFEINLVNNSSIIIDSFTYESRGITTKRFKIGGGKIEEGAYIFTPYFH